MIYNRIEKNLKVWYFSIKGIYNYFIDYTKCTYINWVRNKSTQKMKLNKRHLCENAPALNNGISNFFKEEEK